MFILPNLVGQNIYLSNPPPETNTFILYRKVTRKPFSATLPTMPFIPQVLWSTSPQQVYWPKIQPRASLGFNYHLSQTTSCHPLPSHSVNLVLNSSTAQSKLHLCLLLPSMQRCPWFYEVLLQERSQVSSCLSSHSVLRRASYRLFQH